jgi:GntR family transcriptional regulator
MTSVNANERAADAAKVINEAALPNLAAAGSVPLYERIKRHISEAILMGAWPPGTVLPGEIAFSQSCGVAVGTVRRAMSDLVAEGVLTRRRKTGTVVTGRTPHHSLRYFFQYFRLHGRDGELVRSRVRMVSVAVRPALPIEASSLQLAPASSVIDLHRVRLVDDLPVMHDRYVLAAERVPGFPTTVEEVPELLYLFLLERYGIRIAAIREQLSAELATAEDQDLLGLKSPAPVLAINDVAFDQNGLPTIFGMHRATTEKHTYVNEVR